MPDKEFAVLSHVAFPGRSVRIKKSSFCDGNVGYACLTGYKLEKFRSMFETTAHTRDILMSGSSTYSSTSSRAGAIPTRMMSCSGRTEVSHSLKLS